jgi:hypothetical protein
VVCKGKGWCAFSGDVQNLGAGQGPPTSACSLLKRGFGEGCGAWPVHEGLLKAGLDMAGVAWSGKQVGVLAAALLMRVCLPAH